MTAPATKNEQTNTMWGGRFELAPDELMVKINASIDVDKRFYREDIEGSIAHATMLGQQGILKAEDVTKIIDGLKGILTDIEAGNFTFTTALEDIHLNIEARLKERIGDVAGKLHTARSRNDQVAVDFRLWLRRAIDAVDGHMSNLQQSLRKQVTQHVSTVMPGFTHLQVAQPVTLGLHLDAYVQMLHRDRGRMADCRKRLNENPLGACALSGTSFPTDREQTTQALGFDRTMWNTMDAVGSRDFALEFLAAASIAMIHLSRLAEELVLWSTPQFGFVRLSDNFTTGSSIMPQKKNPDAAELIRAKSGVVTGNLMQLLMIMKALPLTYNKDMQEDKPAVFSAVDNLTLCLQAMGGMIDGMQVKAEAMAAQAEAGFATATEIADWLVRTLDMPFREAHHVTGRIVKLAETKGSTLAALPLSDLQSVEPRIDDSIYKVLDANAAVAARLPKWRLNSTEKG